jgi:hypothetical protein
MDSIVLNLQKEAMDLNIDLSDLLRKAYVVAKKLKISEFEEWIKLELYGYNILDKIPRYRVVMGVLKYFDPHYGYLNFFIDDPKIDNMITQQKIDTPIAELEDLYKKSKGILYLNVAQKMLFLKKEGYIQTNVLPEKLEVSVTQLNRIFDSVRNIILDWSLRLEEDGILGENLTFTLKEKEIAQKQNVTYNMIINDSQVQVGERNIQNINEINLDDIKELLKSVKSLLNELKLDNNNEKELNVGITTIESQLYSQKPNQIIIKESLKSIRNILEGCASNAIAPVLIAGISKLIGF